MNLYVFLRPNCFFNESVCFFASSILEEGSVTVFSYELISFLEQNCFFNESVFSFGFRHFVRRFCGIFII